MNDWKKTRCRHKYTDQPRFDRTIWWSLLRRTTTWPGKKEDLSDLLRPYRLPCSLRFSWWYPAWIYLYASDYPLSFGHQDVNSLQRMACCIMMTSSNGNIFRVTGPLCGTGEFPAQRPVTRSFDVYFDLRLNKRLSNARFTPNHDQLRTDLRVEKFWISWTREQSLNLYR